MSDPDFDAALRASLSYDPETGKLHWLRRVRKDIATGAEAGHLIRGYRVIGLKRKYIGAHRIAWFLFYGAWPVHSIDHIDGNRSNNKIKNLRDVPQRWNTENVRQAYKRNLSGFLGVTRARNRWDARIRVKGKNIRLGSFSTPEEAHAAYLEAKRKLHEGCTI